MTRLRRRTGQSRLVETIDLVDGLLHVKLKSGVEDYSELPSLLLESGRKLRLFREEDVNLETAFMELTKGQQQ